MDGWMDMHLTIGLNYETTYYMGTLCLHCIILPPIPTFVHLHKHFESLFGN
jgi:hypothetical protein